MTSEDAGIRIQKYLSRSGLASRREGERLIVQGRVRVNGTVVTELGSRIVPGRDRVEVDGRVVQEAELRWVMLNKPMGAVTTRMDPEGRQTVFDLLPSHLRDLRYVGRLDLLTEGLLLFTNEGEILHRLTHPSFEVEREYQVWVQDEPGPRAVRQLLEGVELEDGTARASRLEVKGRTREGVTLSMVLREGRNREVRRLMEAVGQPVLRLKRVRFGPVRLGDLKSGEWRDLTNKEIRALRGSVQSEEVE
ncbi:MAG: pseudouridine synthase [Longimicrobiales bacterium]